MSAEYAELRRQMGARGVLQAASGSTQPQMPPRCASAMET